MSSRASSSPARTPAPSVLAEENALLRDQVQALTQQLDWFKKQLFGPKSEKRPLEADTTRQAGLFDQNIGPDQGLEPDRAPERPVRGYSRGTAKKQRPDGCVAGTGLRFIAEVPVEIIRHLSPELTGA